MASSERSPFDKWLSGVLEGVGVDGEVYGEYISGSLAAMDGSPPEEIQETVQDILSGCLDDDNSCQVLCGQVVDEWAQRQTERVAVREEEERAKSKELAATLQVSSRGDGRQEEEEEGKVARAALVGGLSASDKRRLVARYGDLSNDEDDDTEDVHDPGGGQRSGSYHAPSMTDVFQNMNARLVTHAEREKREKEKVAHEVKVERDRNNREVQKQKVLDRKEKEKKRTQKHEKRR